MFSKQAGCEREGPHPCAGGVGVIGAALALRAPLVPSFKRATLKPSVGELEPLPCVGLWRSEIDPLPCVGLWRSELDPLPCVGLWRSELDPLPCVGLWRSEPCGDLRC